MRLWIFIIALIVWCPVTMSRRHKLQCNRGTPSHRPSMHAAVERFNSRYKNSNVRLYWDEGRAVPRAWKMIKKGSNIVAIKAKEVFTARESKYVLFQDQSRLRVLNTVLQKMLPEYPSSTRDELRDELMVTLLLIHEKLQGKQSRWAPYLDLLPPINHDFHTAAFITAEEAQCLGSWAKKKHKRVHTKLDWTIRAVQMLAMKIPSLLPEGQDALVRWAVSVFQTRSAGLPAPYGHALIPWLGMLNHHSTHGLKQSWHVMPNGEALIAVNAIADVQEGDEVYDNYGDVSVESLMLTYGFLDPTAALLDADHRLEFVSLTTDPHCWNSDQAGPLICGADLSSRQDRSGCKKNHPNSIMMACARKLMRNPDASEAAVMAWGLQRTQVAIDDYEKLVQAEKCKRKSGNFPLIYSSNNITLTGLRRAVRASAALSFH